MTMHDGSPTLAAMQLELREAVVVLADHSSPQTSSSLSSWRNARAVLVWAAAQRDVPGTTMEQLTVDPRPGLEFVHSFILQPDPALALDALQAVGHVLAAWLGLGDVSGLPSGGGNKPLPVSLTHALGRILSFFLSGHPSAKRLVSACHAHGDALIEVGTGNCRHLRRSL